MKVIYAIELSIELDAEDSAEDFRLQVEKSIKREWVKEAADHITVRTKSIEPVAALYYSVEE